MFIAWQQSENCSWQLVNECSLAYKDKEPGSTYNIQQIVVSVVKMLIKKFFSTEAFLTVSTSPFIYIHMNLVLFLISEQIIVVMKSTLTQNLKVFSFHKWHQILHKMYKQQNHGCHFKQQFHTVQFCNTMKHFSIPPQLFSKLPYSFLQNNVLHEHALALA